MPSMGNWHKEIKNYIQKLLTQKQPGVILTLSAKRTLRKFLFIATIKFTQCLLINTYYLHSNDYFAGRL